MFLIKHSVMKTYEGVEAWLHTLLSSALDEGEWSLSRPDRFTPRGMKPRYPWDERLGEN
jgi:hypothetical protein